MKDEEDVVWIVEYDPGWAEKFERERLLLQVLQADISQIEHIGSTSVPGLAAKPIVDILMGLQQLIPTDDQIRSLEQLNYVYEGQVLNIPEHYFLRKGMPRLFHLHIAQPGSAFWQRQILFRDFLRAHPDQAQEYVCLKRSLATQFRHDRKTYAARKTPLIEVMLSQARAWQRQVQE
ncbi:GrpB family protein [Leptolyngbya sp. FACHB-671]|uniref:GrpB family protein n=1 Tax=Leptolyngbya sp. FACHB-671 TaxID=2692812 RepID=UPI0016859894|nr:GrpB family protein [Leptolyngbya sp. FACHB-671]MBD2069256.1 GrpB family protein [Leptolyngbya sp. FACHB-671]